MEADRLPRLILGPFDVVRKNGTAVVVIPDVLTGSVVGDIKNWASLSFTQQLQDFALIANPANAEERQAGRTTLFCATQAIGCRARRIPANARHRSADRFRPRSPRRAAMCTMPSPITSRPLTNSKRRRIGRRHEREIFPAFPNIHPGRILKEYSAQRILRLFAEDNLLRPDHWGSAEPARSESIGKRYPTVLQGHSALKETH